MVMVPDELTRLLGGIRSNSPAAIGEALIKVEQIFLKEKLIAPYNYCFIGTKR
ncbi:MAG: hypothetical protein NT096_01925 [Proteobacteria bacterium]|nr:hypothetical protein [Pseudomonadota bacterium]